MNVEHTAKYLIKKKFSSKAYQKVQDERLKRLNTFKLHKIPVLVRHASQLLAEGEEVLKLLKQAGL
jgi:hypothetical protein